MSCSKHTLIEYEFGFYCFECGEHFDKDKKKVIHNPYDFNKCGLCKKERKEDYTISKFNWAYFPVCEKCYFELRKKDE